MAGFREHAPEGYWYALAAFSHQLEVVADFTRQTGEITDAYSRLGPASSEIDVYDAVYDMLDMMGQLPGRRILAILASGVTHSANTSWTRCGERPNRRT
jgi:hypothetical protein